MCGIRGLWLCSRYVEIPGVCEMKEGWQRGVGGGKRGYGLMGCRMRLRGRSLILILGMIG